MERKRIQASTDYYEDLLITFGLASPFPWKTEKLEWYLRDEIQGRWRMTIRVKRDNQPCRYRVHFCLGSEQCSGSSLD